MKADDFLKNAIEQYRNEVSGCGVPIKIPELGMEFYLHPVQPTETMYIFDDLDAIKFDHVFAIKLICGRAKTKEGHSIFDSNTERDKAEKILMEKAPPSFTSAVASRVILEILDAFPVTSIEEAGNDSEEATSLDSTSTLPKNEAVQSTN